MVTDVAVEDRVLAHYRLVGAALEKHFAGTPIVFANFPGGFTAGAHWHATDIPLSEMKMLWLCHRMFAIEFHSWAPLATDITRLRFARILLEQAPDGGTLKLAATTLRALLAQENMQAIAMFDGQTGMALWIPLADAPQGDAIRAWLHPLCARAVNERPDLFSTEPNTHNTGRVHLHVASNCYGRYSALPYSVRGADDLPIVTPIRWNELDTLAGALRIDAFAERFASQGDVFGELLAAIPAQNLPRIAQPNNVPPPVMIATTPRGSALTAAIEILDAGGSLTAQQILDQALARKLVQPKMSAKYVYTQLLDYIVHALGNGLRPQIVQNPNRTFRINEPPDDWPQFDAPTPAAPLDAPTQALIARLETTSRDVVDSAAFEVAVCDAFAHLGFQSTHVGGYDAPDGYADAQLGVLGYRLMIECKTAKDFVTQPDCVEAAKYRTAYSADYCTLVGPQFNDQTELTTELQMHGVTAVTVADLRALPTVRATALEIQQLLKPGYATDALADMLWERSHGDAKRIATIAHIVHSAFWDAQGTAAQQGGRANAPLQTVDAAMLLVDEVLKNAGSEQQCTREDVVAAFEHLTDPFIGVAVYADSTKASIVVMVPPGS